MATAIKALISTTQPGPLVKQTPHDKMAVTIRTLAETHRKETHALQVASRMQDVRENYHRAFAAILKSELGLSRDQVHSMSDAQFRELFEYVVSYYSEPHPVSDKFWTAVYWLSIPTVIGVMLWFEIKNPGAVALAPFWVCPSGRHIMHYWLNKLVKTGVGDVLPRKSAVLEAMILC